MRVMFMGTPEFAVPCLERLLSDGHEICMVVTQADKPKGRGHKTSPPPVKECALTHSLPVFQPDTLRTADTQQVLRDAAPEVIVVVAYGKLLPQSVLEIPPHGCINVHASLLPKYRGAAPIQWAVLNGESQSGVTTMFMDVGLDTGDMLLKSTCAITDSMTAGDLHDALSIQGAELLSQTITALQTGSLRREKQDDSQSCYAPMLGKHLSALDFSKPASVLHNQVRGLNPWPTASFMLDGKILKVHRTVIGNATTAPIGTVICEQPLTIACGEQSSLVLKEVQYEGGRRMNADDFFRGHPLSCGTAL